MVRLPPVVREVVVLVVVLAVCIIESASVNSAWSTDGSVFLVIPATAALGFRRRFPAGALTAIITVGLVMIAVGGAAVVTPLVVMVYSICVHRQVLAAAVSGAGGYAALVIGSILFGRPPSENVTGPIALVFALTVGWSVRNRRQYRAAMIERAEHELRIAAADERARIARELHDVIAHSLSVMVRLADGAAAVALVDQLGSQAAMRHVGRVGRDSLRDVRGLLGALGESEPSPQPRLADITDLVESYRRAGLPVSLSMGQVDVGEGVELVLFRTVQESLTNALRYAHQPTVVTVKIAAESTGVTVEIMDDGRGVPTSDIAGSNRGIDGLRERVAMYGGTLVAGPRMTSPGWFVRVQLPVLRGTSQ